MKKVIGIFVGKAKDFKGFKEEKKMTKADEMFEELGYKEKLPEAGRYYSIKYYKDDDNVIYFDEEDKEIHKDGDKK